MDRIKDGKGHCELCQVTRGNNEEANLLAKIAIVAEQHLTQPFQFKELHAPVMEVEESFSIEEWESWMKSVYKLLTQDKHLADEQ